MITKANIKNCEFKIFLNNPPSGQEIHRNKKYKFKCALFPEFNITNLVFAISSIGFDKFSDKHVNDLSFIKLPKGRTEVINNISKNIIIDYAHNSHSFEVLLCSIKKYFDNLILVFGFGGERDKSKRAKMLKIALENSSKIFLTSDNSRSEKFENIIKDAMKGNNQRDITIIEDRKEAIINANKFLDKNSCLLILGKGHEQTQEIDGKIYHFSDHEVVDEIYN
jgi:UDP-N-acetylmuramyl tripeptide synthase